LRTKKGRKKMPKNKTDEKKAKRRLFNMAVHEVSYVDKPANAQPFVIFKRFEEPTEDDRGGVDVAKETEGKIIEPPTPEEQVAELAKIAGEIDEGKPDVATEKAEAVEDQPMTIDTPGNAILEGIQKELPPTEPKEDKPEDVVLKGINEIKSILKVHTDEIAALKEGRKSVYKGEQPVVEAPRGQIDPLTEAQAVVQKMDTDEVKNQFLGDNAECPTDFVTKMFKDAGIDKLWYPN
jgi:hypothetical protein